MWNMGRATMADSKSSGAAGLEAIDDPDRSEARRNLAGTHGRRFRHPDCLRRGRQTRGGRNQAARSSICATAGKKPMDETLQRGKPAETACGARNLNPLSRFLSG